MFPGQPSMLDISGKFQTLLLNPGENKYDFYCESQANSPFNLTWHKQDGSFSDHVSLRTAGEILKGPGLHSTYTKRRYLEFRNFSEVDVGRYICVSSNLGGNITKAINIRIKSKYRFPY